LKIKVDGKEYGYDPTKLLFSEAAFVQKRTGLKVQEWQAGLAEMDAYALAGLVYILRKRAGEAPDWDDFDFDIASLEFVDDDEADEPAPKEAGPAGSETGTSS
jgi:hypothetical protein